MAWNVDRRKMYAHVYFDLSVNTLGLAVYSIGKIPGFSGALSDDLKQGTQVGKAYDLFLKTLGKDQFTKEELQLGKRFNLHEIEDKLKKLDVLGKLHAENPDASVVVDLDDPLVWFNSRVNLLPEEKQKRAQELLEQKKKEIGQQIRAQEMEQDMSQAMTPEDQEEILQRVYPTLSRGLNPKSGPKDFPGKRAVPPTFMISKEFDVAYYPGFRGAQYMTKVPKSLEYVHPQQQSEDSNSKWHHILIPDTKQFMDGKPLSAFEVEPLDYASETLARLFFYKLSEAGEKNLTVMDFNRAIEPVVIKAKSMLKQISATKDEKVASSLIGTWIDLHSGKTFDSEAQLIGAKVTQRSEQERLPLAAERKINKLAQRFLKQKKFMLYARLVRKLRSDYVNNI